MTTGVTARRGGPPGALLLGAAVCAAAGGIAASVAGPVVAVVLAAAGLFAAAACRPVFATCAYLAALPVLAGIERGSLVPGIRPNEALLVLLFAGAVLGGFLRHLRGEAVSLRLGPLDAPLAAFVVLGTLWPVTSMMMRGQVPHGSDVAAVLPLCKLVALMLLVRITVVTERQLICCIRAIVWPAAVVAVVAVLQTLDVAAVLSLLGTVWETQAQEAGARGTSTLGSSIATGDYVVLALTLVVCCGTRGILDRRERWGLSLVLGAGVLAAGQFSTWLSAIVAGVVVLRRFPGHGRAVTRFLPAAGLALVLGLPAFLGRITDFSAGYSLPRSWLGRWDNLTHFYLPQLGDFRFVLGVSPNSVLAAPETWREVIYLESGYLQLLWMGGLPLLAAFGWLTVEVLRTTRRLGERADTVGVLAVTLSAGWWIVVALSVIDIHLVLRGFGDLLFVLLGIISGRAGDRDDDARRRNSRSGPRS